MTVAVQKFQVGDVVKEASAFGMDKDTFSRRTGIIKECKKIKNKAGRAHFHYEVLWDGPQSILSKRRPPENSEILEVFSSPA